MRTPSNNPNRHLARRCGLVGLALTAALGAGLATAAAASADDDGGPDAVFQIVDPVLNPILGPAPDRSNGDDDPTELNLECDPATGACRKVPGPGQDDSTTTAPVGEPTGEAKPHRANTHHPRG